MGEKITKNKPKKIIYGNQKEIHNFIFSYLQLILANIKCEAYLVGSSTTCKFGKYNEPYEGEGGSDMDLVIFLKEIPLTWNKLNIERNWWELYRIGELKIDNTIHFVNAMVVKKGMRDIAMKKFKELKWNVEEIKKMSNTFLKNLNEIPFNAIKSGKKNIEIRANKNIFSGNSVNLIKEGDFIIFKKVGSEDKIKCTVERKTLYKSIRELLESEGTQHSISTNNIEEGIRSIHGNDS